MSYSNPAASSLHSSPREARDPLVRLSAFLAACTIIAGLLVLVGWGKEIELLKRVQPGFTAMSPAAAMCFVLSGLGIAFHHTGRSRASLLSGLAVAAVAILKIVDLTLMAVPIDQVLFFDRLNQPGQMPNRMAPNTAAAFLLAGLSLAFSASAERLRPQASQGLAAGVLLIAMFALIGYSYGMDTLHRVGPFIPMAIHTGVLLLALSLGLLLLRPDCGIILILRSDGAAGSLARTILPLAILIPLVVGAVRLWGQNEGYYGTEGGVALQVMANVLVTSALLISSIIALHNSDKSRRRRERALARSEAQYRLAEQVAHVGHWQMDLPSFTVEWSKELFQICGRNPSASPPSAKEMLNLYHPDDRELVRKAVKQAVKDGIGWEYPVRLCRPDGELRHVSSRGLCERDTDGNLIGLFGVFADVTELEHARRQAEAATAAKAAFLANMSHEIRTPLNGVMGFAELLLRSKLPPEQKRHANLIFDSAQALLKLLNDILDVSKIDAGQLEVVREPFDLKHQLSQCVRLMAPTAQKKKLELSLRFDPALPQYVLGDGLKTRQVLLNLLGNALKFTDRGSVRVEAETVAADSGVSLIQIHVIDTGVGIPQSRQGSVFEEFVQADASISRRFGGSGLGLSISRRLVALMGGEMSLESREGVGTRISLTLPFHEVEQPLRRRSDSSAERTKQPELAPTAAGGARILLVEDLDINQELITGMLTRMGYRVDIASDGRQAIRHAQRLASEPDCYQVIFMDVQMPVVDGISATRAIRALGGRASEIPIIALTANAFASEVEECRAAGMNDHLSKPVSMAALGAAVMRWLPDSSRSNPRRRPADTSRAPVSEKFAARVKSYAERLCEIRADLTKADERTRIALVAEAQSIAHNVAGTAGMFGNAALGDFAAVIAECLRGPEGAAEDEAKAKIEGLWAALNEAA